VTQAYCTVRAKAAAVASARWALCTVHSIYSQTGGKCLEKRSQCPIGHESGAAV